MSVQRVGASASDLTGTTRATDHRTPAAQRRRAWAIALLIALASVSCDDSTSDDGPPPTSWLESVERPLPEWLSETGLFADVSTLEPAPGVLPYVPPHPLYSNGTDKHRLIYLPPGAVVDTADSDRWDFPVGTVLVKTFSFRDVEGRTGAVPIETRLLFRRAGAWDYAVYHWSQDGMEARLLEDNWSGRALELFNSSGQTFRYSVPSRLDCRACHETHFAAPVIGLGPRNLDPALLGALPTSTDTASVAVTGRTPEESAVMSYLLGNCAHCHHGQLGSDNASFSLLPEDLLANTLEVPTASSASGQGIRIVPGDPDASALYEAVVLSRRRGYVGDFKPMPPVGIDTADPGIGALLRAWIESL